MAARGRVVVIAAAHRVERAQQHVGEEEVARAEAIVVVAVRAVAAHLVFVLVVADYREKQVVGGVLDALGRVQVFPSFERHALAVLLDADEDDAVALVYLVDALFEFGGAVGVLEGVLHFVQIDSARRAVGGRPLFISRPRVARGGDRGGEQGRARQRRYCSLARFLRPHGFLFLSLAFSIYHTIFMDEKREERVVRNEKGGAR